MKIKVEAMKDALKVLNLVPVQSAVKSTEFIKFICDGTKVSLQLAGNVHGTADVVVENPCDPFVVFVDRKQLLAFVGPAKRELLVEFNETLNIRNGRRRAKLVSSEELKGYTGVEPLEGEKSLKMSDELTTALKLAQKYATEEATRPELNSIHISKKYGKVMAADGQVLFTADVDGLTLQTSLPVTLPELIAGGAQIKVSKLGARILFAEGRILRTFNELWKKFPADKMVASMEALADSPEIGTMSAVVATQTIERLVSYVTSRTGETVTAKCTGLAGKPLLSLVVKETYGTFTEKIRLAEDPEQDFEFLCTPQTLLPFLQACTDDITIQVAEQGHLILTSGNFTLVASAPQE
jgi:hypothetical protein